MIFVCRKSVKCPRTSVGFLQKVYDFRKSNVTSFRNCISAIDWSPLYQYNDVNDCVDYFYEQFSAALSTLPISFVKTNAKTKPWITPVVIDIINKRWKAYRDRNFCLYNHYKEKVKSEIYKSKIIWSKRMRSTSKGLWSIVKHIRGKYENNFLYQIVSLFSDSEQAAENVNQLFSDFFQRDVRNLDLTFPPCRHVNICNSLFVKNLLVKLRCDKAMGSDHVPTFLLKTSADHISEPLSFIYNLSFNTSCVPINWKIADVIPVPKSQPVKLEKLRPISLLPTLSKVLERIVLHKYIDGLTKCYDVNQFAYRRNSSTTCALITINEKIVELLDEPLISGVRVIAFDMSHAFDSVPHDIIIKRMLELNFPDCNNFVKWIHSYLSNRRQRVRIGDTLSSVTEVKSGVPQGSVLGPYIFAIFMSSYTALNPDVSIVKYADDVTIVVPVYKNSVADFSVVNNETQHFEKWCDKNCMFVNRSKTKVLNVSTISIPSVPSMSNVNTLKILGLVFNDKLTWSNHFDYLSITLSRRLYVLRMLKPLLTHDQLVNVFNCIMRSVIDYASQVFLNPGSSLDLRLLRLCKRAFYIIHGRHTRSCNNCDLLNVHERRKQLAMKLFNNALSDPDHVLHRLIPQTSDRSDRVILPHVRHTRRVSSFVFYCAARYNGIV